MPETSVIMQDILKSLGIVLAFVVAGKILIFLLDRVVRKITEKTATQLDDMVLAVVEKPAFGLLVLWGVYIAIHRLTLEGGQGIFDIVDKAVFVISVTFITKVVYDVINALLDWYGIMAAERGQEGIGKSILPLAKKLVKVFAIISGLIVILDHFNYNISSLVAALGVSSLAVGLAAKETLSNMISGFTIVADRPFRLGDRIDLDGKVGDIVEIGLRSTKMKTLDNTIVVIPNSKLVENVLVNLAYPELSIGSFQKFGVEYGSDVGKVKEILKGVAADVPEILAEPAPDVLFIEYGDSAMVFQLVYKLPEYRMKWPVIDKVNTLVNRRFAEAGIGFAFPARTVYLHKLEDIKV